MAAVSLIQLDCSSAESPADRIARTLALIPEAATGSDLVALPELWNSGAFDIEAARANAEPLDGPLVAALCAAAQSTETWLHGGSFTEIDGDEHFNTSVLIRPDGSLAATYRKIHLFGFDGGETTLMSGGDEIVIVDTPLGATDMATCYDLRFPELFRALTEQGATCFLISSGWPAPRIVHWDVLTRARAIEDQAWVVACNEVGQQPGISLGGYSCVIDPKGNVIAQAGESAEILRAEIDPELPMQWREQFPALRDIRMA